MEVKYVRVLEVKYIRVMEVNYIRDMEVIRLIINESWRLNM